MNDMTKALKQLRLIWAVESLARFIELQREARKQWLAEYYRAEEVSDRNASALTY